MSDICFAKWCIDRVGINYNQKSYVISNILSTKSNLKQELQNIRWHFLLYAFLCNCYLCWDRRHVTNHSGFAQACYSLKGRHCLWFIVIIVYPCSTEPFVGTKEKNKLVSLLNICRSGASWSSGLTRYVETMPRVGGLNPRLFFFCFAMKRRKSTQYPAIRGSKWREGNKPGGVSGTKQYLGRRKMVRMQKSLI